VHKVVMHPSHPERLFLQNHWGLYRSDNGADRWEDIARKGSDAGVPSDFGFPMVVHPHDPDTVYIVPLESDEFRCTPGGRLRVYRTRDGGGSWEPLTRGLPQKNALETVLRDAMAADPLEKPGIYFGTRSGQVWASADAGNSWRLAVGGLPPVVCVKAAVVGDGLAAPRSHAGSDRPHEAALLLRRRGVPGSRHPRARRFESRGAASAAH